MQGVTCDLHPGYSILGRQEKSKVWSPVWRCPQGPLKTLDPWIWCGQETSQGNCESGDPKGKKESPGRRTVEVITRRKKGLTWHAPMENLWLCLIMYYKIISYSQTFDAWPFSWWKVVAKPNIIDVTWPRNGLALFWGTAFSKGG